MKKLLIVNTYCNVWSTGRIAAEIGQFAEKQGWTSFFAYADKSECKPCGYFSFCIVSHKLFRFLHFLLSRLFNLKGFGSWIDTVRFIRVIKKIKPDVIHLHNIHADYINIPLLFKFLERASIPIVWTLHDCWVVTGGCTHFAYWKCYNWKEGCNDCPRYRNNDRGGELRGIIKNMRWMQRKKVKMFNAIPNMTFVPVSSWTNSVIKESALRDIKSVVIPNGVDISTFYPKCGNRIRVRYNLLDKFIILGVASSWSEQKGLNDYLKLSEFLPNDCVIILVGLDKLPSNRDNIIVISRTANLEELVELYSASDVVVSMSYQETFGLTIVEGMACGTPCIVYNNTSLPELIHLGTGYIVESGNIEQVLDKILIIKEKGKKAYSEKCISIVRENYVKEKQYQKYIDLYQNILSHHDIC